MAEDPALPLKRLQEAARAFVAAVSRPAALPEFDLLQAPFAARPPPSPQATQTGIPPERRATTTPRPTALSVGCLRPGRLSFAACTDLARNASYRSRCLYGQHRCSMLLTIAYSLSFYPRDAHTAASMRSGHVTRTCTHNHLLRTSCRPSIPRCSSPRSLHPSQSVYLAPSRHWSFPFRHTQATLQ